MKKLLLLIFSMVLLGLVGCTAVDSTSKEMRSSRLATVEFKFIPHKEGLITYWYDPEITITNKTDDVVEILWNSSSVNGSPILIEEQTMSNYGKLAPNTALAPYSSYNTIISSIKDSQINGEFYKLGTIKKYPAKIVIKVKQGSTEEFIVLEVEKREVK